MPDQQPRPFSSAFRRSSWVKPDPPPPACDHPHSKPSDEESLPLSSSASSSSGTSSAATTSSNTPTTETTTLVRSASSRRKKLQEQAAYDKTIFTDESLGCPLASLDWATLALVGGKALACWRLTRHGFPLPSSYVVPTFAYSLHIQEAGISDLIAEVFSSSNNGNSEVPKQEQKKKAKEQLETIRETILKTPLNPQVVENLKHFIETLPPHTFYAVRSSATAEDATNQSFAGQYDSFLYKTTLDEICDSIKACWASVFKAHILDYVTLGQDQDDANREKAANETLHTPHMAVLIMHMVEAKASGVMFSQNLWGSKNEVMIEAVLGQGEGLVSGDLTPDRYVMDKYSLRSCYQNIAPQQTHKYAKADNQDGVEKIELKTPHEGPILHKDQQEYLTRLAGDVEDFENRPQDMEWALDQSGAIYLLQSRPITTTADSKSVAFLPPGDGFWNFDPTHFPRPVSPWMQEVYSFDYGIEHSHRTGCLIKTIKLRFVHGYAFTQNEMFPEDKFEALEAAGKAYWTKKLYEEDYREFNDWFRPECESLMETLRRVNPSALGHAELVQHVSQCFDYASIFWKKHHTYTFPAFTIVGDYINKMAELTGKDPMECLVLLESSSPESRGILNQQDPLLGRMYKLLRKSERAKKLLECDERNARFSLDVLLHLPDELGELFRRVAHTFGWRLAGGYDIVVPALIESPHFFLKTILQGVNGEDTSVNGEEKTQKLAREWKKSLSSDKHKKFDEILSLGRRFFRMRDERGLATDLSGVGLCRRGLLEAGRRLVETRVIKKKEHLTVAVKKEALALLTGNLGFVRSEKHGPSEVPTAEVLEKRFNHIKYANPNIVPRSLGTSSGAPPPNPDSMPYVKRTMDAFETSLLKGTFGINVEESESEITESQDKVKGMPASMGKVTGPVRLILQDSDLQSVKEGDIVVTYSSSASFNIVLGLCAAIVTDFGGMLSHAAIVAREYGIPAVVGTQDATKKFKSGDLVCVDTSTSIVAKIDNDDSSNSVSCTSGQQSQGLSGENKL